MVDRPPIHPLDRDDSAPVNPGWQPRYGISLLLLIMLVMSMLAAAAYYMVRSVLMGQQLDARGQRTSQLIFIVITLASPVILTVVMSVGLRIVRRMSRPRRKSKKRQVTRAPFDSGK